MSLFKGQFAGSRGSADWQSGVRYVGLCYTDLGDSGEAASGYYKAPWQWPRIREHQQWIAIYNSTDDPHIPIAEPRSVAAQLKCSYFEFDDRGHFVDSREPPEVVEYVKRKLNL